MRTSPPLEGGPWSGRNTAERDIRSNPTPPVVVLDGSLNDSARFHAAHRDVRDPRISWRLPGLDACDLHDRTRRASRVLVESTPDGPAGWLVRLCRDETCPRRTRQHLTGVST